MSARAPSALLLALIALTAQAGDIVKHTSVETDGTGRTVKITETLAAGNGDVMFLSYGVAASASSSGGDVSTSTQRGPLQERMLFRSAADAIVINDGGNCQSLGGDSGVPGAYSGAGMQDYQQQMAAAQAEMEKAYAEMAQQNPQLAEQMRQMMSGRGNNPMFQPHDELELVETGNTRTIGDYATEEFQVRSVSTGQVKHTVWATDIDEVDGGRLVGRNGAAMVRTLKAAFDRMGVGGLGAASIMSAIGDKMETHYPIVTVDHDTGHETRFAGASDTDIDLLDIGCGD
ncbi:MAG: hypothetical protein R3288_03635 [Woeseiaceae bacterium]|nr:hypothetical protein [Woeseiaceae bacterium]